MEQRNRAKGNFRLSANIHHVDPYGGVLVITTCWRPRPDDPNPEHPGDRVSLQIYHPTNAEDFCPCGSGKRFDSCCQWLPYWRPVCPNPWQGCSLMRPQSARFTNIPYKAVHTFLQDDERLHCIEDTPLSVRFGSTGATRPLLSLMGGCASGTSNYSKTRPCCLPHLAIPAWSYC